jgi:hypothetical protein
MIKFAINCLEQDHLILANKATINHKRLMYKFIFYCLLAVVFSFMIHEFAHWVMGECLGNKMRMTLNTGYPVALKYNKDWHFAVVSSVGPLVTLLQAIIFYLLIRRYSNRNLYPFLFTCFYLELLSGILTFRNPNDLGRIGVYLNIGLFTLPTLFIIIHFLLVYRTCKRENYKWRFILTTLFFVILFSSLWVGVNQLHQVILI